MAKVFRISIRPKGENVQIISWARAARGARRTVGVLEVPRDKLRATLSESDTARGLGIDQN